MTVKELHAKLQQAMQDGHGDTPVSVLKDDNDSARDNVSHGYLGAVEFFIFVDE